MNRAELTDLYFLDARSKLIEIAAFLDRIERAEGESDYRFVAFTEALQLLASAHAASGQPGGVERRDLSLTEQVLRAFSDPTLEPSERADGKAAKGAWPKRSAAISHLLS